MGAIVGDNVGDLVVGAFVGLIVGECVGAIVGDDVGECVGFAVGECTMNTGRPSLPGTIVILDLVEYPVAMIRDMSKSMLIQIRWSLATMMQTF